MSNMLLQAKELRKNFGKGENRVEVLHGVDLKAERGTMTAIVGASGSGKTTLLQILGTLDSPDEGELIFAGRQLTKLSEKELSRHRNTNIGFIFQFHHLLPEFSALENVMMPGRIGRQPEKELGRKAKDLLTRVGLAHRLNHRPGELSGGEQQRVALARALILKPALLLADEPTGNLDTESGNSVFSLLQELCRSLDLCVIMVTHNLNLAASMDKKFTLIDGKLSQTLCRAVHTAQ
ncbi:MAG TPA: ABC transporter ATP-binding protein [Desulfobulbaceae bacterium]|nr:ABC transporter ATP-binding protein [Desulfobulbaceae bacterium]